MACPRCAAVCFMLSPLFAGAQSPQPNTPAVTMRSVTLNTADAAVQKRFWTGVLPCTPEENEVRCAAVHIIFNRKAPSGPSVGSVVNHIGFFVPSIEPYFAKVSQAGYKNTRVATGNQIMIDGPDGVRVELTSDPNAALPIRFHHVHFYTPAPREMQAWYARVFGAIPGKRAQWDAADIPGANLTFTEAKDPVAPTEGRAVEAIGLESNDVNGLVERVKAMGIRVEAFAFTSGPNHTVSAGFIDPWGTRIQIVHTSK